MIVISTVTAAYTGTMAEVTKASFDSAKSAVTLAIGLIGPMALWLGIMKVAEAGGLMRIIARAMRPLMIRLFPDVPAEHPAKGSGRRKGKAEGEPEPPRYRGFPMPWFRDLGFRFRDYPIQG